MPPPDLLKSVPSDGRTWEEIAFCARGHSLPINRLVVCRFNGNAAGTDNQEGENQCGACHDG